MCVFLIMTQSKKILEDQWHLQEEMMEQSVIFFPLKWYFSLFTHLFWIHSNIIWITAVSMEDYFPLTNKEQTAANNIFKTFISYQCCSLADKLAFWL